VSGQLVTRLGKYKGLLVVALLGLIGAFALVATTIDEATTAGALTVRLAVVGLALGPGVPVLTLAIQNGSLPRQVGVVTAAATFARQIGGTIGTAVLMTVFATVVGSRLGGGVGPTAAITAGIRAVFWTGAGFAALALVLTLAIPELPLRKTNR